MSVLRRTLARVAAMALLAVLSGCTNVAVGLVNALVPTDSYVLADNIAYGSDARQRLDVYTPKSGVNRPVVLFFYGGSWKYGARGQYRFLGEALSSRGFVVVIADYRVYPAVKFPAFQDDAAHALKWTRDHAAEHNGNPDEIFVMGHSAGANIAALLALDPSYMEAVGVPASTVKGLIGLAGPYTFHPEQTDSVKDIFLGTGDLDRARPIVFVGKIKPPPQMFLAHGRDDDTVYPLNTEQLAAKSREAGGTVREVYYNGVGHIGLMGAFARPFRGRAPVLDDVAAFLNATAVPPPAPSNPG